MDLQHFLTINIMVIAALTMLMGVLQTGFAANSLWIAVNLLVIVVGAAALQAAPGLSGILVTVLFIPLVVAPLVLSRLAHASALAGDRRATARRTRWLARFHPTRRLRFSAAISAAQAEPTTEAQVAALHRLLPAASFLERLRIDAEILRLEGNWQGLANYLEANDDPRAGLGQLKVNALGSVGRLDDMVQAYEAARSGLIGFDLLVAQLVVLAHAGRRDDVGRLLAHHLAGLGDEGQTYWTAIAERASGGIENDTRQRLETLARATTSPSYRRECERLLTAPPIHASATLSPTSEASLNAIAQRIARIEPPKLKGWRAAPVTYMLIAIILAVYLLEEINGGSENVRVLVDMGALWPPYVERRGEWWRLGTAIFLHLGLLHAGINALMLLMLGRLSEHVLGSLRTLLVFLLGGLASTSFVYWLAWSRITEPAVLVGASGGVMAIFGGIAAERIVSWLHDRDEVDKRALVMLPAIIVLQVAADLASPQVSLAAHASGLVAGLVIGAALATTLRRRRSPTPVAG